jgi:hypothetical protein
VQVLGVIQGYEHGENFNRLSREANNHAKELGRILVDAQNRVQESGIVNPMLINDLRTLRIEALEQYQPLIDIQMRSLLETGIRSKQ